MRVSASLQPFVMFSSRFPTRYASSLPVVALLAALAGPPPAVAQDPAIVEAVAGVLQAEDARQYNEVLFMAAARHADPLVRQVAALGMGRIGNPDATPQLLEMLRDPDSTVVRDAAFALGLLRDSTALPVLRDFVVNTPPDQQHEAHAEAMTAILKIGGPAAAAIMSEVLGPWVARARTAAPPLTVETALEQAWRLGADAPVRQMIEFAGSPLRLARLGTVYSLARLRATGATDVLMDAIASPDADFREAAVRALTASFADSAGLDRTAVANRVRRLASDDDPHVRINALRTLATYRDSTFLTAATDRLTDADPNVRVQAVTTIADLGGQEAEHVLRGLVSKRPFAVQRNALIGYARLAGVQALDTVADWLAQPDWTRRAAGAEALGHIARDTVVPWLTYLTQDSDPRVAAVALTSLTAIAPDTATVWSRQLIGRKDAVVRALAAERLGAAANPADIDRLVAAYRESQRDSIPDAKIAIVSALGRIADQGLSERLAVEDRFLTQFRTCDDYLVRRAAQQRFPEAARRWGPVTPIETGRRINDYRQIARRYVVDAATTTHTLVMDTDRGRIVIDLFPRDAPITVNAFLQLVDRRLFDGETFHRVVPNFVVQSGDPRGDGWGGPGYALRDEINLHHYERGTVGMALSGPDTGGSQFFITLSPQPHLDGTYTVIGRVIDGMDIVDLITQGDRIQTVRRQSSGG
jgi:cyclophilin family peptidyl-prolyl cis-trans isomerase/HEAT repeat protein